MSMLKSTLFVLLFATVNIGAVLERNLGGSSLLEPDSVLILPESTLQTTTVYHHERPIISTNSVSAFDASKAVAPSTKIKNLPHLTKHHRSSQRKANKHKTKWPKESCGPIRELGNGQVQADGMPCGYHITYAETSKTGSLVESRAPTPISPSSSLSFLSPHNRITETFRYVLTSPAVSQKTAYNHQSAPSPQESNTVTKSISKTDEPHHKSITPSTEHPFIRITTANAHGGLTVIVDSLIPKTVTDLLGNTIVKTATEYRTKGEGSMPGMTVRHSRSHTKLPHGESPTAVATTDSDGSVIIIMETLAPFMTTNAESSITTATSIITTPNPESSIPVSPTPNIGYTPSPAGETITLVTKTSSEEYPTVYHDFSIPTITIDSSGHTIAGSLNTASNAVTQLPQTSLTTYSSFPTGLTWYSTSVPSNTRDSSGGAIFNPWPYLIHGHIPD